MIPLRPLDHVVDLKDLGRLLVQVAASLIQQRAEDLHKAVERLLRLPDIGDHIAGPFPRRDMELTSGWLSVTGGCWFSFLRAPAGASRGKDIGFTVSLFWITLDVSVCCVEVGAAGLQVGGCSNGSALGLGADALLMNSLGFCSNVWRHSSEQKLSLIHI